MNVVCPMETHDSGTVDANTGGVVRGEELDEEFGR